MSLEKMTFIAPLIRLPLLKKPIQVPEKRCKNNHKSFGKFCSQCGEPVEDILVDKEKIVDINDIVGFDRFYCINDTETSETILFSNKRLKTDFDPDDGKLVLITQNLIESSIAEFTNTHEEDIKKLVPVYGEIKVEFGTITMFV